MVPTDAVDLFLPEWRADPYPHYAERRRRAPVHPLVEGGWVVVTHAGAQAVLRDPRFSTDPANLADDAVRGTAQTRGLLREGQSSLMLFVDPPDHTRLRTLVSKAFTPRVVEGLRPRIQQLVDELLDAVQDKGEMDVLADLSYPLPVIVICELLGVPTDDREAFKGWSSDASRLLDGELDPEVQIKGIVAAMNLIQYFNELFEDRRQHPRDDLLSGLVAAEEAGDRLSEEELRATTALLFVAGHETTMNLIGNGMLALLRHRDQLERLQSDPSLVRSAVEELLRYDGPVHVTARIATEDLEVEGASVRAGEQVVVALGAANRDPAQFPGPDRLDVGRVDNHHVAFSHGIHFCLGASLARAEGQIAVETLVRRMPGIELVAEPRYREHFVLRGLEQLRVAW